jgi:hypothetical protein
MDYSEKRWKRIDGNIACWVSTFIFIGWNVLWIGIWSTTGWSFDFPTAGLILIFTLLASMFPVLTVYGFEQVLTTGFKIYHFKVWDKKTMMYIDKWDYRHDMLYTSWIYNWHYKNWETSSTIEDIKSRWEGNEQVEHIGYNSREEVMKEIINWAKNKIANEKADENVKIIEVEVKEYYTAAEILDLVRATETK